MKSFTRAISNIIKSQPYQTGRYFDKDNIMVLNEQGDTFQYDKTSHNTTLRVNGVTTVLPTNEPFPDDMFNSINGQLINQKTLLLNFVREGEIQVTALAITEDWLGGGEANRIFNPDTMRVVNEPSQIRLTKLSPEMTQFIKTHGGYASSFLNGDYVVNNLVDMINQGNDIIINACVEVESNLFPTPPSEPPVVTTPPKPAMAIVNMTSDTPFISTFKNGFELESYYDAQIECYRIENENNKVYLRDPAYAPVVSFKPKQGNLMGATQIQGEVYDWKGIGFDIRLATPKHLNKIQNTYGFPSNDVVLVMFSQLNEGQSAPPVLNGRFVCNPEIE